MPYWARKDWDRLLGLNFVVSTPLPQTRSSFRPGVSYFKQQALLCDRRALVGEGGVAHFGGQNADMRAYPSFCSFSRIKRVGTNVKGI
jgi:hypothetical protein